MKIDKYMPISHWMLKVARPYVIKHKGIFEKAIIAYAKILPEPTLDNTYRPNIKFWIKERDKFRKYYTNPAKEELVNAAWKIWIDEYAHDGHYVDLIDVVVEDIKTDEDYEPRMALHPLPVYWSEPYEGDVVIKEVVMVQR